MSYTCYIVFYSLFFAQYIILLYHLVNFINKIITCCFLIWGVLSGTYSAIYSIQKMEKPDTKKLRNSTNRIFWGKNHFFNANICFQQAVSAAEVKGKKRITKITRYHSTVPDCIFNIFKGL